MFYIHMSERHVKYFLVSEAKWKFCGGGEQIDLYVVGEYFLRYVSNQILKNYNS